MHARSAVTGRGRMVSLVVLVLVLTAAAFLPVYSAAGPGRPPAAASRAAALGPSPGSGGSLTARRGIPAELARAIRTRFGPGPMELGQAPLAGGIVAAPGGWSARAPWSVAAQIGAGGSVSAQLANRASASLQALSLSAGGARTSLPFSGSSLGDGQLSQRLGPLTSAYRVTAGGLEERFTIAAPPARGARELTVQLRSPQSWRVIRAGSAIVPTGGRYGKLAYGGLRTTDARGRVLGSHFQITRAGPRIVLDTSHAAYPLTIDPVWTSTSTPTATLTNTSGATSDQFGYSVSLSSDGTTALIGAPSVNNDTGAAYVFEVSSTGSWASSSTPVATLTNSSGGSGDNFGNSVSLSSDGTTALIGAYGQNSGAGAAYVYRVLSETSWVTTSTPKAVLTNASGKSNDYFGISVALSPLANVALIGASGVNSSTGAAYVFKAFNEASWATSSAPSAILTNGSGAPGAEFGSSVALSYDGTTALIGAYGANSSTGAAYIFHASSLSTTSAPTATLLSGSGGANAEFGHSVALSASGTTALIGANGANSVNGAAYVYHVSSEASWVNTSAPTATLTSSGTTYFGYAVALSADGKTALIGASGVNYSTGAAYLFQAATEASWATSSTPSATLTNGSGTHGAEFGSSVALSSDGSAALIGAPGVNLFKGAAYVFATQLLQNLSVGSGSWPTGVTYDSAANEVYVALGHSNRVVGVPSASYCGGTCSAATVSGFGTTLAFPESLTTASGTVFASNFHAAATDAVSTSAGSELNVTGCKYPAGIATAVSWVWVTCPGSGEIAQMLVTGGSEIVGSLPLAGAQPSGVVADPTTGDGSALVGDAAHDRLYIYTSVNAPPSPDQTVALESGCAPAYLATYQPIAGRGEPTYVYVACPGKSDVEMVQISAAGTFTGTPVSFTGSGSPVPTRDYGLATNGSTLVVTGSGSNDAYIYTLSSSTGEPSSTQHVALPAGSEPDGVAIAGSEAYIADEGTGQISVIDPPAAPRLTPVAAKRLARQTRSGPKAAALKHSVHVQLAHHEPLIAAH